MPSIKHQVFSLFFGKLVSMLILILLPIVLVRLMEKTDYGLYQQGILIINFLGGFFIFGVSSSYYYFYRIIEEEERRQLLWQSNIILISLGLIFLLMYYFLNQYIFLIVNNEGVLELVLPIGLAVLFYILSDPIEHIFVVEKKSRNVILLLVIQGLMKALLVIGAFVFFNNLSAVFWSLCFFYCLKFVVYQIYLIYNYWSTQLFSHWNKELLNQQVKYTYPLGLGNMVGIIGGRIDRFILSAYFTSSDFAMYSIAQFRIPIVSLIFPAVSNVIGPQIAICSKEGDLKEAIRLWHKMIVKFSLVVIPFTIYSIFSAQELITLLYTEKYIEAAFLYQLFLVTFFMQMLSRGIILSSFGYTKYIFKVKLISAIFTVIISFSLIPKFGVLGAALSYVIAFYFGGFLELIKAKRILELGWSNWFPYSDISKTLLAATISLLIVLPFKFLIINKLVFLLITSTVFFVICILLLIYLKQISKDQFIAVIKKYLKRKN